MSEKTLKLKRIFVYTIHSNLKSAPAKEYSTGELKSLISDILPGLSSHIAEYVKLSGEFAVIREQADKKEITQEVLKTKTTVINDKWKAYSADHATEVIDIVLSEEAFKSFNDLFNKETGGKLWVQNIDEYSELLDAFTKAAK